MADAAKITSNMIWRLLERFGAQSISIVLSFVLARILEPSVYGIVALISVFTGILDIFVNGGFGNALIQKKNADDLDFSSVFYFNCIFSIVLYLVLFFTAPLIAAFYNDANLVLIIRIMSLSLIISGIKNVQISYIAKKMQFKKFFFSTLGGTIGAAIVGITMAYLGYGVWALIIQNLFNNIIDTIILWITIQWYPKFKFSKNRLLNLWGYGWKILASQLLDVSYNKLRQLIIGKMYSKEDLAFYNKADLLPFTITTNINASIDNVLFPTLSIAQDNIVEVKAITRRAIKTSTFLIMPMMMGFAACAEPFIRLILTEKWLPCVPFIRIFCITYAFYPIQTTNLSAIKAMGYSNYLLKLNILKKIIGIIVLLSTMWFGVMVMVYSLLLTSFLEQIINAAPNKKLLNYGYIEQITDISPQIFISLIMSLLVFSVTLLPLNNIITLLIQIPLGVIIYILLSKTFKVDSYEYTKKIIRQYLDKLKKNK